MLEGQNVVVIDTETLRSADDCQFCQDAPGEHMLKQAHVFTPIGWENKAALGLSIGCLYRYDRDTYQFFDEHTLEDTVRWLVETRPLIVTFNGEQFDAPLMRSILRHRGENTGFIDLNPNEDADAQFLYDKGIRELCDSFKALMASRFSYDLLQKWWDVTPRAMRRKGENNLGTISEANGFGTKEMDGAMAPRLWAQGRHAEVVSYCLSDVWKTRKLFEQVCQSKPLLRKGGSGMALLPLPAILRESEGSYATHMSCNRL